MTTRRRFVIVLGAGALATPLASFAQKNDKVWRVGFLSSTPTSDATQNASAFLKGMRELGYVEGKNLVIEWRSAEGKIERLPGLAAELVQLKVDVIVADRAGAIGAAQKATSTIPIVMATTGDPIGNGFVKSLARPGGNITGLSTMSGDTGAKLVDLLLSVMPNLPRVAVLNNPASAFRATSKSVEAGARKAGVKTLAVEASTPQEIESAFSMMAREKAGAFIVGSPSFSILQHRQIAELALKYRMPSISGSRRYVDAGGLMSYGTKVTDLYQRSATYVDKILQGAKPGELPVEQPVTLELVVNLKTAKAIGLRMPQTILLRASEVVE